MLSKCLWKEGREGERKNRGETEAGYDTAHLQEPREEAKRKSIKVLKDFIHMQWKAFESFRAGK